MPEASAVSATPGVEAAPVAPESKVNAAAMNIKVTIEFGYSSFASAPRKKLEVAVAADGSTTIAKLKALISAAEGVPASEIQLEFGPNTKVLGRADTSSPITDDQGLTLKSANVLSWLERFPHWHVTARRLPTAPLDAMEAIVRTVAATNGLDPDAEVAARKKEGIMHRIDNWDEYQARYLKNGKA